MLSCLLSFEVVEDDIVVHVVLVVVVKWAIGGSSIGPFEVQSDGGIQRLGQLVLH